MTELHDLFHQAQHLPYGAARTAALEAVVQRADDEAPDSTLPFEARIELTYAYRRSGETLKSFVPFAWCTSAYDADPARYTAHTHPFLWAFKWQPGALTTFPQVPLDQALDVLADMERRYRAGGHSLFAVHQVRLRILLHLGEMERAEEEFRLWGLTSRDDLADCTGCVPSAQTAYLIAAGRYEDAIRIGDPVLKGTLTCSEQPQSLLTHLLPAYVATARLDEAAVAHRRAYALLRNDRGSLGDIADHIEFLGRTGNAGHALAIVERHLGWLDSPDTPWAEMIFAASSAHALGQLPADTMIRDRGRPRAVAEVAEELAERARGIAARFDERNGNGHISTKIERDLSAQQWVDELPLSATARREAEIRRKRAPRVEEPVATEAPALGLAPDALLDHFDVRWMAKDRDGASIALDRFETEVSSADRTAHQAGRLLEAQGLLAQRDGLEGAVELWRQALELLNGIDELRTLRCRGRIGYILGQLGQVEDGVLTGEEPLRRLVAEDDPDRRPGWAGRLGVLLMQADRPDEVEKVIAPVTADSDDAEERAWVTLIRADAALACLERTASEESGSDDDGINRVAELYEEAVSAAQSAGGPAEIQALWNRGRFHLFTEPGAEEGAAEDLTEAVAQAAALGMSNGYLSLNLLQALLEAGRLEEAAHAGEEADRLLPEQGGERHTVHHLLAVVYDRLGQRETALENIASRLVLLAAEDPAQNDEVCNTDRAVLHDWRGKLLDRLDRDTEAADAFDLAASLFERIGDGEQQLFALRRAGASASWADDDARSSALREQARALLGGLAEDGAHPAFVTFQEGALAWDGARAADRAGRAEEAITLLHEAERLYRDCGEDDNAAAALVYRARLGDLVPSADLRPIFETAEEGSLFWHNVGYQLLDALQREGDTVTAERLQERLEA